MEISLNESFRLVMAIEAYSEYKINLAIKKQKDEKKKEENPHHWFTGTDNIKVAPRPQISIKTTQMSDSVICGLDNEDLEYLYAKHKKRLTDHLKSEKDGNKSFGSI